MVDGTPEPVNLEIAAGITLCPPGYEIARCAMCDAFMVVPQGDTPPFPGWICSDYCEREKRIHYDDEHV